MSSRAGPALPPLGLLVLWTLIFSIRAKARAATDEFEWKELPMRSASQCFNVRGVPVLNLRCEPGELIRVQQAFYGAPVDGIDGEDEEQAAEAAAARCSYDQVRQPCIQYTSLKENCMGRNTCTLPVSNPFLANCEQYANYMQVNYTCVPRERIHDICQEVELTTWQGYLRSPNYPADYGPSLRCRCQLKTRDSSILLRILDFALNISSGRADGRCREDKLSIESWGDKCNPVVAEGLPEMLALRKQTLGLSFSTDQRYQDRGFWLEFRGSNGGKVTMTCSELEEEMEEAVPDVFPNLTRELWETTDDLGPPGLDNNESTDSELFEETTNNIVLIDDSDAYPRQTRDPPPEESDNGFETYDFSDHQEYHLYNVADVQLATGIVVSVLILIAVIIIIVLVFRR